MFHVSLLFWYQKIMQVHFYVIRYYKLLIVVIAGGITLEDKLRYSSNEEFMVSFEEKHDSECVVLVGVL